MQVKQVQNGWVIEAYIPSLPLIPPMMKSVYRQSQGSVTAQPDQAKYADALCQSPSRTKIPLSWMMTIRQFGRSIQLVPQPLEVDLSLYAAGSGLLGIQTCS
jgi:hypothetical protein